MAIQIGRRAAPPDFVGELIACHERIRNMVKTVHRLAEAKDVNDSEVTQAAAQVRRYFEVSLRRHMEDEAESVLPRLKGKDANVDQLLGQMAQEHDDHEPAIAKIVNLCGTLESAPERLSDLQPELRETANTLQQEFDPHLQMEEEKLFPAVRSLLSKDEHEAMHQEMRARRNQPGT